MAIRTLYDQRNREIKSNNIVSAVLYVFITIIAAFVIINNFLFFRVSVDGESMQPTFYTGDIVLASYYAKPERYSVIIIKGEKENGFWLIKRAIAFGGETVRISGGYVYLKTADSEDFIKLDEDYVKSQGKTFYPNAHNPSDTLTHDFYVESGEIFYLGDNRMNSSDSRSAFGTCTESQIVGVVSDFAIKLKTVTNFFDKIARPINNLFNK